MKRRVVTASAGETERLGRETAAALRPGQVLALEGELGAGKTTFVRGLARGLGLPEGADVHSPTFVLVQEYATRVRLYHIDAYRLERAGDEDLRLLEDCMRPDSITVIEWPTRVARILPVDTIHIRISHLGGDRRAVEWAGPSRGKAS